MSTEEKQTVERFIRNWLLSQKPYIKQSTYSTYFTNITNHILPYFGEKEWNDITINLNQKFILYLHHSGRLDGKGGLSVKTIKDIMSIWMSILKSASEDKLIILSSHQYRYPKTLSTGQQCKCLSKEQERAIIHFCQKNNCPKNLGILLALATGMRIGEICALQWKNIDLTHKVVQVDKTLQRISSQLGASSKAKPTDHKTPTSQIVITTPKSHKSARIIPLTTVLAEMLQKWKGSDNTFFLTGKENRFMEPRTYRAYYTRILSEHQLLFVTFHGLRHTFATRCIEAGCDYKTVSEILGHANVETTLRLYVHSDMEKKRKCVDKLCRKW